MIVQTWLLKYALLNNGTTEVDTIQPGFYKVGDEVYRITGKSNGNAYYNLDADEPRWAGLAPYNIPKEDYFSGAEFSEENPIPRTR